MAIQLHKNIVVEPVGDDLLVCDLKGSTVAMLSGSHADVVRAVTAGDEVPASLTHLLDELITRGVLRDTSASSLFSRRKALGLAAGAAGAGFLTLAMPQVAVAASGCVFALAANELNFCHLGTELIVIVALGANPCNFQAVQLSLTEFGGFQDPDESDDEAFGFVVDYGGDPAVEEVYLRGVFPGGSFSNAIKKLTPLPPA